MKKTRYSESPIIKALNEIEGGRNVKTSRRDCRIFEATYYNWKRKSRGLEASYIKVLKELED